LRPKGQRQQPPAPGAAVPVTPPVIAESKLANGMTLVTARTGNVPLATMTMVFRGGASTDPRGKAGTGDARRRLLPPAARDPFAPSRSRRAESLGASISSGAGPTASPSPSPRRDQPEAAGRVLADIVQNAQLPADEVERPTQAARWTRWACDARSRRARLDGGAAVAYGGAP
jgi:zinc protease